MCNSATAGQLPTTFSAPAAPPKINFQKKLNYASFAIKSITYPRVGERSQLRFYYDLEAKPQNS